MKSADRSFQSNKDYYLFFGLIILLYCLSINTDYAEYSLHRTINIPGNFFYYTFGADLLVMLSAVLILLFRKVGVLLFPLFVAIHFALHNYFLSTFLYSDVTVLFLYIGLGLVAVIPRWKALK
ncbi:MAG: hypothetical protein L6262_01860 [Weeksellaceae bacterium]|nr:hypothetical protein [Weeksellaceae bacterium]